MNHTPPNISELNALKTAGWTLDATGQTLRKTYRFKTFAATWGWMAEVALYCEKINHHPDWQNSYNRVEVLLTTHDTQALSQHDTQLAQIMDQCFANRTKP